MIKKYFILTYIARAGQIGSQFLIMIMVNNFSPGGVYTYGQLTIIISTAGMISSLLTMRTGEAVTKFLIEANEENKEYNYKTILYSGMSADIALSLLVLLIVFLTLDTIGIHLLKTSEFKKAIFLYGIISAIDILRGVPTSYFQSIKRFTWINGMIIFRSFFHMVLLGFAFYIGYNDLTSIVICVLIVSVLSFLIDYCYFIIKAHDSLFSRDKINRQLVKKYFKFNFVTFISTSIKAGNQHMGQLILGYFLSPLVVGTYQTLKRLTFPIIFMATPFQLIYYPQIVKWAFEKSSRLTINIRRSISLLSLIGILYGFILLIFLKPILYLVGIEYDGQFYFYVSLIVITVIAQNGQWWSRSFSNAVNPVLSVVSNLIATIFQLTIVSGITYYFGMTGFLLSQMLLATLLMIFWLGRLNAF